MLRRSMVVMKGMRKNGLYALKGVVVCDLAYIVEWVVLSETKI